MGSVADICPKSTERALCGSGKRRPNRGPRDLRETTAQQVSQAPFHIWHRYEVMTVTGGGHRAGGVVVRGPPTPRGPFGSLSVGVQISTCSSNI